MMTPDDSLSHIYTCLTRLLALSLMSAAVNMMYEQRVPPCGSVASGYRSSAGNQYLLSLGHIVEVLHEDPGAFWVIVIVEYVELQHLTQRQSNKMSTAMT